MRVTVFLLVLASALQTSAFEIVLGLPQRNLDQLNSKFWAVSTPGNPEYLQFSSVRTLANMIGSDDSTISNASQWLASHGGHSIRVSPLRDTVTAVFDSAPAPHSDANWIPRNNHPHIEFDFVLRRDNTKKHDTPARSARTPELGRYTVSSQKKAYGIPEDLTATNSSTLQMVWGPGSFGYSVSDLTSFKNSEVPLLNLDKVNFDTKNHGHMGDNYGEGNLDTQMISAFGLNASTLVSNTNTSASTEEGLGFGQAMLDFVTQLSGRKVLPQVLSLSLGSLSAHSCNLLCDKAQEQGVAHKDCVDYIQTQRQVCMFLSEPQQARIDTALQVLGTRGVSIFGSSGDGGSHFSFEPFSGGHIADVLNKISCEFQLPIFPSSSPHMISVGGTVGSGFLAPDLSKPKAWSGTGGGFSWEFAAAAHQHDAIQAYLSSASLPPSTSFNASGRGYPDISALAVEGTSQSSPIVAGIFSLIIDARLNKGLPPLGFVAPRLYASMAAHPGKGFTDVTSGNSQTSCDNGFPSQAGWDPVTGFGQPKFQELMEILGSDETFDSSHRA